MCYLYETQGTTLEIDFFNICFSAFIVIGSQPPRKRGTGEFVDVLVNFVYMMLYSLAHAARMLLLYIKDEEMVCSKLVFCM